MNESHLPDERRKALEDRLVSYLDGELDAAETSEIEHALAIDPRVRVELKNLEQCWDMLDELPRTEVDEDFTRSTVEMIAIRAEQEQASQQAVQPSRRRRAAWLVGGGLVAASVAGFIAIAALADRSNVQLLRDLPVIENLEQYRQVEDVEFLRLLKDKGLFEPEAGS